MTSALVEKLEDVDKQQRAGVAVEPRQKTIRDLVKEMEPQFRRALPNHVDEGRFVRLALTALELTPGLAECTSRSILAGLTRAAQLGLEINADRGQAYLIPRKNRNTNAMEASFQLGYKGLIDLAGRGGITVRARDICEQDLFEYEDGLEPKLRHVPELRKDRGDAWAYFAIATFPDERVEFVVMSKAEVEKHRDRFASARNKKREIVGPWTEHFDAMARKTVIIKLLGQLPLPVDLADAIAMEDIPQDVTPVAPIVAELAPAVADSGASEIAEQGPVPPPVSNDSTPTADVPPAEAKTSALPQEGEDDPDRRALAAYGLDEARKHDHETTKAWQAANGIPNDSRKWDAEQISKVIDWIHEEPEPA